MKEVLTLIGVFALGYILTMGLVFALLKLFFPFQKVEKDAVDTNNVVVKINRSAQRTGTRLRKVRLANG